ncbi:MAG: NAD(P)/FAD-dependent oxidoreductase, partial [Woeseiaceae bacterium]
MENRVVIAGAGHAAGQVVVTLKQKKFEGEILLVGEEPYLPYQRPPLSKKFLAGELPIERLYFKPASFYAGGNLRPRLDSRIESVDRDGHCIVLKGGNRVDYGRLVLAVGARVRRLSLPGAELPGVHYLRTVDDVLALQRDLAPDRRIVIVGAGYIGLEVAAVTCQLGLDVTVVEMEERVMSRVVSAQV